MQHSSLQTALTLWISQEPHETTRSYDCLYFQEEVKQ